MPQKSSASPAAKRRQIGLRHRLVFNLHLHSETEAAAVALKNGLMLSMAKLFLGKKNLTDFVDNFFVDEAAGLAAPQAGVNAAVRQQRRMRTLLHDAAAIHYD